MGSTCPRRSKPAEARVADLADELISQRAASRIGEQVQVLVEEMGEEIVGRAAHQGPEVDGAVRADRGRSSRAR